jgi:glycosyltransferase involved in cell wall biosynthesis
VLREIAERRPVTAVYSPIWDCEGVAILVDGTFPLVLGLQTTLHFWLHSHPHHAADEAFRTGFAEPMLSLEARLLRGCHRVHAISTAIARDISDAYDVVLTPPRTRVVPLGLEDWSQHPRIAPKQSPDGTLRLLFAGRLEARKGIDVFLLALQELMPRHPTVQVDVVGNDQIPGPSGTPYRTEFEAAASPDTRARVKFHGRVTDEELRGFYCHCDVFVAPSRFESFGLVLLEAMMFAKPVVACRTGGMVEVAEDGITALLADPGDKISLVRCLERLISNADLRHALGSAGRKRYEAEFTPVAMALGVVSLMRQAQAERTRSLMPLYP